jgi:uncharacterized membrane protein
METNETFTVNKPRNEVYSYWRQLENLPRFMKHLKEVKVEDSLRSTWKAEIPGGLGTVSWESVITEDQDGELISWASLPGSTIDNAGEVRFMDDPLTGATEVRVSMTYRLPAGDIGTLAGKLFSPFVRNMIQEDVRRFKSIMEIGETVVTGSETSSTSSSSKPKKARQSRRKPDPGIDHSADPAEQFNESDLLERS